VSRRRFLHGAALVFPSGYQAPAPGSQGGMTRLCVFDFDGTLFRSPEEPAGWPAELGCWDMSPESLSLPYVPLRPPSQWWVKLTLLDAHQAIRDPNAYTVLLTGRPDAVFHDRVHALLGQQGLGFDEVHLNPGVHTLPWKTYRIQWLLRHADFSEVHAWEDKMEHLDCWYETLDVPLISTLVQELSQPTLVDYQEDGMCYLRQGRL